MALTTEQQEQVEFNTAIELGRNTAIAIPQARSARLEAVRMAKETLIENARTKPVGERDVTAADIIAFADVLAAYINT